MKKCIAIFIITFFTISNQTYSFWRGSASTGLAIPTFVDESQTDYKTGILIKFQLDKDISNGTFMGGNVEYILQSFTYKFNGVDFYLSSNSSILGFNIEFGHYLISNKKLYIQYGLGVLIFKSDGAEGIEIVNGYEYNKKLEPSNQTKLSFNLGFGYDFDISKNLVLKTEVNQNFGGVNNLLLKAGLRIIL